MSHNSIQKPSPILVHDVIELILSHLYYIDNRSKPDSLSLSRYSRVSRAFRLPSQILLFRQVKLRTARDLESIAFALTAKTPHAQILQDSVRVLRIRVNGFRAPNAILPEMLPDCLKLFPYLYELRLNVQRVKEFDKAVLKALETDRTTPSRIQSLIIHKSPSLYASNLSVFTGEFTMLHLQLLRIKRWPLKYFAICGDFSFGFCGHYKPPIHQFTAIRLDVPDMGSQLDELMSWLLTNSSNTIEHLSAPRSSSLPREIVEKRRVQSIDCFNLHNLPPTTYSNAEEALWFRLPFVRSTIPDSHLVRSIPKGVKHLGFDADVLPIRLAWWRNLAPSLSKSLKRISVVGYIPSMDMKEDEESISDVLGNIEIRLYANIWDYRTATPIYFIPDKPFPHQPSIRDFDVMTRMIDGVNDGNSKRSPPKTN